MKDDPHAYYKKVIAPFKGKLELWIKKNIFMVDVKLINYRMDNYFPKNKI